ncbi:polysaccharide deacetylase family protein [Cohnella cellulosilytica]|uniref:Polysaccharide deacetylase family protein n=1 Tax=Cohnella cellulosilytica TaxID=986710 RepID=A0ABW2FMC1_9BACL
MRTKRDLPTNSLLLTFDDGYIDHYLNVFPILMANKIRGLFAVPGKPLTENKVLAVNKIHFILAIVGEDRKQDLLATVYKLLNRYRGTEFDFPSNEELYDKLAIANRFDDKDIIFIKRLLQMELPEWVRDRIIDDLFRIYIPISEGAFSRELYMNFEQIRLMKRSGMDFAVHGYEHYWLGKLTQREMKKDINKSLETLEGIVDSNDWTMVFPYGSYNPEVLAYISDKGCKLGFTTEVRVADLQADTPLVLPRLDTTDFPPQSENYLEIT